MPAPQTVTIVPTDAANVASVRAALTRCGVDSRLSADPHDIQNAEAVILPGVGAFGAAMKALRTRGADRALQDRISGGRPTLCVCLGLQLLFRASEEAPGVAGLGLIDAQVTRFGGSVRVPQMGWNQVHANPACRILRSGFAYFANSYHLAEVPADWMGATSDHGGPFVAALERGAVVACQFHPELSGPFGQSLLERWLQGAADREHATC